MKKEMVNKLSKDIYLSLLKSGKGAYVDAWGMSMYPFVKNGDRIKIVPVGKGGIRVGDIAAVDMTSKSRAWFFVHRVVKITERDGDITYFTKGDAHKKGFKEPVTPDLIVGKIVQIERKGLQINLDSPIQRRLNAVIAKLSVNCPGLLHVLSKCASLAMEPGLILFRIGNRFKKKSPVLYNTGELLLVCVREHLDDILRSEAIDMIKEGIDWQYFTELAMRRGVAILVYDKLRAIASYVRIPQGVFDRLKSGYITIVPKAVSQYKELTGLLNIFDKNKIRVIPLKGALLSKRLYGSIEARGLSTDIDLLVKEEDKENAIKLLTDIGYKFNRHDEVKKWQWQYKFTKAGAVMTELHWDVTMACRSKERINGLWRGIRCVRTGGALRCEFKEEELLLYLSAHLVNSDTSFMCLRNICDIDRLLVKYRHIMNWDSVIEKSKKWRLQASLYAVLLLCRRLLNTNISGAVLDKIKPFLPKRLFINAFAGKNVVLGRNRIGRLRRLFLRYIFFELIESRNLPEYMSVVRRVMLPAEEPPLKAKRGNSKALRLPYIWHTLCKFFRGITKVLGIKPFY